MDPAIVAASASPRMTVDNGWNKHIDQTNGYQHSNSSFGKNIAETPINFNYSVLFNRLVWSGAKFSPNNCAAARIFPSFQNGLERSASICYGF
jgi:hypothetical protein